MFAGMNGPIRRTEHEQALRALVREYHWTLEFNLRWIYLIPEGLSSESAIIAPRSPRSSEDYKDWGSASYAWPLRSHGTEDQINAYFLTVFCVFFACLLLPLCASLCVSNVVPYFRMTALPVPSPLGFRSAKNRDHRISLSFDIKTRRE